MNRRRFVASAITTVALSKMAKALGNSPFFQGAIPNGPFLPYWESLKSYRCPEWFRDQNLGSGPTGARSACLSRGIGTREICISTERLNMSTM